MKDSTTKILCSAIIVFVGFGCNLVEKIPSAGESGASNNAAGASNRANRPANVEDAARDALGLKKSGIPECDELIDEVAKDEAATSESEETYTERLAKELIKQKLFDRLNKSDAERPPAERQQLAAMCKKALDSYRASQTK